jgi:hypothetical protein
VSFVRALHGPILHLDLVSWDVAIGEDGSPILLELNFRGAGELYQWALGRSIFGEHTGPILEAIASARRAPVPDASNADKTELPSRDRRTGRPAGELDPHERRVRSLRRFRRRHTRG